MLNVQVDQKMVELRQLTIIMDVFTKNSAIELLCVSCVVVYISFRLYRSTIQIDCTITLFKFACNHLVLVFDIYGLMGCCTASFPRYTANKRFDWLNVGQYFCSASDLSNAGFNKT
jgi:hypothetical protein